MDMQVHVNLIGVFVTCVYKMCNEMCKGCLFAQVYPCPSNKVYRMYGYRSIWKYEDAKYQN